MSPLVPIVPYWQRVTQLPPASALLGEAKLFAGLIVDSTPGQRAVPNGLKRAGKRWDPELPSPARSGKGWQSGCSFPWALQVGAG